MAKTPQARTNAAGPADSNPAEATASVGAPAPAPASPAPARADDNPPQPGLSARDLGRLHQAFEETGNKRLGQVLDRLCDDPECGLREGD